MATILLSLVFLILIIRFLFSVIHYLQLKQFKFHYRLEILNIIFFCFGYFYAWLWVSYYSMCTYYTVIGLNFYYFILYTLPECFLMLQLLFWILILICRPEQYLLSNAGWTTWTPTQIFINSRISLTLWDFFVLSFGFLLVFSLALFKFISVAPILFNSYIYLSKGILELKLLILGINYLYLLNFSRLEFSISTLKFLGFNISLYLFATCLLLSSNNLFLIFLTLELQNFLTYILISAYKSRATTISSIFLYLIINSILTIFFLFSLLIIYGLFKTLILTELQVLFSALSFLPEIQPWLLYSLILNLCILLFKLASAPFHFWIRDIYAGISFSLLGFFIINTKFVLFFVFLKLLFIFSSSLFEPYLQLLLLLSGLLSIFIGSLLTLSQITIKTFLICSSIPHTGYLLLGLLNYTNPLNLVAASGYLFQYLLTLLIIWSILNYFLEYTPQLDISLTELNNYLKYFPGLSILLCLCLLSLAGIPPLVGFFFKYHLLVTIASTHFSLVLFILLGSLISCYYYLNIIKLILIDGTQKFSFELVFNFIKSELQYMFLSSLFFTFLISSVIFNTIYTCNLTLILLLFF